MEITKAEVYLIALLLSLGLNIYEILKCQPYCDNSGRFTSRELPFGGKDVDPAWAKTSVENYRSSHATDISIYKTTGFMVSKKVFEEIFNTEGLNTLSMDLIENENGVLSVLLKGIVTDSTAIDKSYNSGIYINQALCPADCAEYR